MYEVKGGSFELEVRTICSNKRKIFIQNNSKRMARVMKLGREVFFKPNGYGLSPEEN